MDPASKNPEMFSVHSLKSIRKVEWRFTLLKEVIHISGLVCITTSIPVSIRSHCVIVDLFWRNLTSLRCFDRVIAATFLSFFATVWSNAWLQWLLFDSSFIDVIYGVLLYRTRAFNSPALILLREIGTDQASPTDHTLHATTLLLNYQATHPNPTLRFVASDMILPISSNASYFSVSKYWSRAAIYVYLSSSMSTNTALSILKPSTTTKLIPNFDLLPPWNGTMHILCQIVSNIIYTATDAKIVAVFLSCKEYLAIRQALLERSILNWLLQSSSITIAPSVCWLKVPSNSVPKLWICVSFGLKIAFAKANFVYWWPGKDNRANYFTKYHAPSRRKTES